ncbi:hypothetical protein ACFY12_04010 [Streptomyces sp. NPDC001339]|uniref:hypothetical protein n=1 Tax=Streptomyces sp. NPDC001339 TaxID=3364563 RepID=UPI0036CDE6B0
MSVGWWERLRFRVEEAWNRHVRYRELYRHLDQKRAEAEARTAWMEELTEEGLAEMMRGLNQCIDSMRAAGSSVPDRPEGHHEGT